MSDGPGLPVRQARFLPKMRHETRGRCSRSCRIPARDLAIAGTAQAGGVGDSESPSFQSHDGCGCHAVRSSSRKADPSLRGQRKFGLLRTHSPDASERRFLSAASSFALRRNVSSAGGFLSRRLGSAARSRDTVRNGRMSEDPALLCARAIEVFEYHSGFAARAGAADRGFRNEAFLLARAFRGPATLSGRVGTYARRERRPDRSASSAPIPGRRKI